MHDIALDHGPFRGVARGERRAQVGNDDGLFRSLPDVGTDIVEADKDLPIGINRTTQSSTTVESTSARRTTLSVSEISMFLRPYWHAPV